MAAFQRDVIDALASAKTIDIETIGRKSGQRRRTTIWVVVDGDVPYVRSEYGDSGQWYRNVLAEPRVDVHVAGRRVTAVATRIEDGEAQRRVSDALRAKYRSSAGSLKVMVDPAVEPMTLALAPAD